jgi:hypothetical protein
MPCEDSLPRGAQHLLRTVEIVVNRGSCRGTETTDRCESPTFRAVPIRDLPFPCSTRDGVTCQQISRCAAPHTSRPSASSVGELEELGVGQFWKIELFPETMCILLLGSPLLRLDKASSTPGRGRRKAAAKAFARFSVSSSEFSRFVTLTFRSKSACAYS